MQAKPQKTIQRIAWIAQGHFLSQAQQLFYPQTHYLFSSLAKEVAAKTEDLSLTIN